MNKHDIIKDVIRVYEENGRLTRKLYRKQGLVPERIWTEAFGTFSELKKAAGIDDSRYSRKLQSRQAKIESERVLKDFNDSLLPYNDKYIKQRDSRYKTLLVAGDFHDKMVDPFALRVFLDTAKRMQPDVIVLNGDIFDFPEVSKYPTDLRQMDLVGRMKFVHENIFAPLRELCPDSQIDLSIGNHECLDTETEILTDRGWVKWDEWDENDKLLTINENGVGEWQHPTGKIVKQYKGKMYLGETNMTSQMVTPNHRIIYKTSGGNIREKLAKDYHSGSIPNATKIVERKGVELSDDEIRLAAWLCADSYHGVGHVMLYQSGEYVEEIDHLLKRLNITATHNIRHRDIKEICGKVLKTQPKPKNSWRIPAHERIQERVGVYNNTSLPSWVSDMTDEQFEIFFDTLIKADGTIYKSSKASFAFYGKKQICEELQIELITRGHRATLREYRPNQYRLNIRKNCSFTRQDYYFTEVEYDGFVWCAITPNENFMIRRNGNPSITGNCRLLNHFAESNKTNQIQILLSDFHGWDFATLLGLDKYEINLITKKDLLHYNVTDRRKSIPKNFKVYYDSYVVVHDPKEAMNLGMPGCSNHHHRPYVEQKYTLDRGAYQWHWLGCMCMTDAEYCNGEKWTRGFGIVHIDTKTKQTQTENIIINGDVVCVLGKYYVNEDV